MFHAAQTLTLIMQLVLLSVVQVETYLVALSLVTVGF